MESHTNGKTELYRCIKQIKTESLTDFDKKDLLNIFKSTENHLIRNHIALIFSDLGYDLAVPFILKKIFESNLFELNGTLVYALQNLNCKKHFVSVVKIVCEMGYEARLMAFEILIKYENSITKSVRSKSMKILKECFKNTSRLKKTSEVKSKIQFVKESLEILTKSQIK